MNAFSLRACAKINVGLEVIRKRPDGYHDIQSIFVGIDLHDTLEIEEADTQEVVCIPPVTDSPNENLVSKAMKLYASTFPSENHGAKITVRKRIPTGGGLGGGSSDAATALLAMAMINGHTLSPLIIQLLTPLAEKLGSDVPFFLHAGISLVEGRGEHITPLHISFPWTILLICPGIHIDTAMAYSTLGIRGEQVKDNLVDKFVQLLDNNSLNGEDLRNDFEPRIFELNPILANVKARLHDQGAIFSSMSGRGSTMFGLFTSVDNAEKARSAFAEMDTYICHPVNASFMTP
ncbi:MAG: 4-(cytidine 5'-diphospho)-2-C-methyl-D-erythritol kinase [Candidatus Kapabacteria bacterium]|nr:4-(cytidine 5'-diphospho)-2-C-methyl-D-erythritol kinase [Candidatus Kapabacteria bacterium]